MDDIVVDGDQTVYCWTLVGTNTGPGGTGKRVHISGFEEWRMGADGLIAESGGHFDSAKYLRRLEPGVNGAPSTTFVNCTGSKLLLTPVEKLFSECFDERSSLVSD